MQSWLTHFRGRWLRAGEGIVAEQRSNAHILDDLFERHLQLFLIFVFIVAKLGDIA